MLVNLRTVLDFAFRNGFGVPALNANNLEQVQAILEAGRITDSPVIIQLSRGARKYAGDWALRALMLAAAETKEYGHIPLVVHLDHGNSVETCKSAIENGFTSVMMDGSLQEDGKTPSDFAYNVRVTKAVVEMARARDVSVEGEIGCLGHLKTGAGEKEDGHGAEGPLTRDQMLTDPEEARRFVDATGVDALAVAIGTSHGAYKFDAPPTDDVLAIGRVEEIHRLIPSVPLVMHGSSSLPQGLRAIINLYGGKLKPAWGVPVRQIRRAIQSGVRKVNVDTDNRLAITGAIRKVLMESPEKFDLRDYLKPAREAMQEVCEERMVQFGSAGWGEKLRARLRK